MIWAILADRDMLDRPQRLRLVRRLASGQIPREDIDKLAAGDFSAVADLMEADEDVRGAKVEETLGASEPAAPSAVPMAPRAPDLPGVRTAGLLRAGEAIGPHAQGEVLIEFLIAGLISKVWTDYFQAEQRDAREGGDRWRRGILDQIPGWADKGGFVGAVAARFRAEHARVDAFRVPKGYSATAVGPDGRRRHVNPNSMQRLVPLLMAERGRLVNYSGTGAGKTLSATLTARHLGSELTVITCPNNVVDGWVKAVRNHFKGAKVAAKTWAPDGAEFLVINYEMLQQKESAARVASFIDSHGACVGLYVVDEVHQAKQREAQALTARRANVLAMLNGAPDAARLVMSATPVINDLTEGARLVEMVTGSDPLPDKRLTITNCVELHKALTCHGLRWMPDFGIEIRQPIIWDAAQNPAPPGAVVFDDYGPKGHVRRRVWAENVVPVDCSEALPAIYGVERRRLELEQILTDCRLPAIRRSIRRGERVLVYSMYREGIDERLAEALTQDGHKVALFTGEQSNEEKATALDAFKAGKANVLVCTAAIATGVDELQYACSKMILNVLPWTHADYEQLVGRIWRQNQREQVEVIIPVTYARLPDGGVWSWCMSKLLRIMDKRAVADAAVNGTIPEGQLEPPAKMQERLLRVIAEWSDELARAA